MNIIYYSLPLLKRIDNYMIRKNSILRVAIFLSTLVILMFLIHTIFFINHNYYLASVIINGFALPAIFVTIIIFHLLQIKKQTKSLSFKEAFKNSYLPQLLAGIISISFIFTYFNYIDTDSRNVFNYQRANLNYQNAKKEIESQDSQGFKNMTKEQSKIQAEKVLSSLKEIRDKNSINFFSFKENFFIAFLFAVNVFYIIISLFLSLFLRTNTST